MKALAPWLHISRADLLKPSVIILIVANLVPIFGVIFLGWEVFPILLLFWIENVIVGVFNVLKMLTVKPAQANGHLAKASIIPFFCVHYGMFTLVHGIFVFFIFGGFLESDSFFPDIPGTVERIRDYQLGWAVLGLAASHAISFVINYIGRGEYKQTNLSQLMAQPYGRVVVLHLTILIGGFLMAMLGAPAVGLIFLIMLKIAIDVVSHLREHSKTGAVPQPSNETLSGQA